MKYPANVYATLVDKAGSMVTLTVNDKPTADGARTVRVPTLRSEFGLRYRAWVDANLAYVTQKTGGDIGYLHVPNMGESGLVEFGRSYYPQTDKAALIIDERYNGGGFTGDMIIDRLERVLWSITQPREGKSGRNPERAFHGPLVVLINEDTGSNGEFFAETIKRRGLAKVIGMRTWGGVDRHRTAPGPGRRRRHHAAAVRPVRAGRPVAHRRLGRGAGHRGHEPAEGRGRRQGHAAGLRHRLPAQGIEGQPRQVGDPAGAGVPGQEQAADERGFPGEVAHPGHR